MNELLQTADELRKMSEAELLGVFEDSLTNRLREQAAEAVEKHGGLRPGNLETFLSDPDCVRYPTRLVLEYGEMGMHQFAQPEPDVRNPGGIMLYLRPVLGQRPDLIALAVSYMIPVINYGEIITDEHCIEYGSVLMSMDKESYYRGLCELAEFAGARELDRDDPDAHTPVDSDGAASASSGGSCGEGCHCH